MDLIIRFLGLEILTLHASTDAPIVECGHEDESPGDCTTYPIGFTTPDPTPHEIACPDRDL